MSVTGSSAFPQLFSPFQLGRLMLPNRVVMAPMSTQLGSLEGMVTDEQIAFYQARARGGAGMIIVEFCCVDRMTGLSEHRQLSIDTPAHAERHARLTQAIRDAGSIACLQLQHGGQAAKLDSSHDGVLRAPSDVVSRRDPSRMIARALTDDEIERLIEAFGVAAEAGVRAGYQAIEFHGAHGYLLSSFLSPMTNRRDDAWGGDEERRLQFARRVIARVRAGVGEVPLIYRLSGDEFSPAGLGIADMERIAPKLMAAGLDAIHVSTGIGFVAFDKVIDPMSAPEGWRLPYSQRIRAATGAPVITVGQIRWPDTAERALAEGCADLIALGRPLLADPEWPRKAAAGAVDAIRPCTSCNYCVSVSMQADGRICCAENPKTGRELEALPDAGSRRGARAVVVGAGPGGLAAALLLDQAGYRTELLEAREVVGGGLISSAAPPHKEKLDWHRRYLARRLADSGVALRTGAAADPDELAADPPGLVVLATGGVPNRLDLEGLDSPLLHDAYELLMGDDAWVADLGPGPVLVYGGGETGCETAEYLAARGRDVVLVSRSPEAALARSAEMIYRGALLKRLRANPQIRILAETHLTAVEADAAWLRRKVGGAERLAVSAVVMAQGRHPDSTLADALARRGVAFVSIGDAVRGGRIGDAIRDAYSAVKACSEDRAGADEELAC